jgi:hypothetical protein
MDKKKKTFHATQAESERVHNWRVEYWQAVQDIDPNDLIFIEETGINLALTRSYGRAPQGKRAYGSRPYQRGGNVTLIGAIARRVFWQE